MLKLIVLIVISLLTLSATSQIVSSDSVTCLPNVQLREAMRLNEVRKVQLNLLKAFWEKDAIQDSIIGIKSNYAENADKKEANYLKIIKSYDSSVAAMKVQQKAYTDWVGELDKNLQAKEKELKKANRRNTFNKIVYGGAVIGVTAFFILK